MTAGALWTPDAARVKGAQLTDFRGRFGARVGADLSDWEPFHAASVALMGEFWDELWEFAGVAGIREGAPFVPGASLREARFFPGARLNYAENLLRGPAESVAIVAHAEGAARRELTRAQLRALVGSLAAAMRETGVGRGDRVAAWLPNVPETIAVMLAAASIGAVFSSTSPDFGTRGVVDRFGQIEPKILFAADGYRYGGKEFDCLARLAEVRAALPSTGRVVVVPNLGGSPDGAAVTGAQLLEEFVAPYEGTDPTFEPLPFDHPLVILYSSGTTGPPKCIVHRAGGILLKHLSEHQLHCDVKAGDRVFYFTTCGWMMWNWLTSALASEATLVLYDGSPFHPGPEALFDLAAREHVSLFGISAKFVDAVRKSGFVPREHFDLEKLRTITSTGSPLVPEGFEFVYGAVKADVHLASISGGTDLCGCFVAGDPTRPVYAGEIQAAGVGMATTVFDEHGREIETGATGELVCTAPFPSMPLGFWNDADGARYRAAYFDRFPGVWTHGDFASRTEHGGFVIHGRSDATLNPGGVRIGTAEIYRQVEQLPEIAESIVIGQAHEGDTRIVLFVRTAAGVVLDDSLQERIRRALRDNCSPRHVPAKIVAVTDIPRTRSGKLVELAVGDVVAGRPVRNLEALANPEALDQFRDRAELR